MNSLSVYALACELKALIVGARVKTISWLPYSVVISLEESRIQYIHLVYHQNDIDIIPAKKPQVDTTLSREIMSDTKGMVITDIEPVGLDRTIKIILKARKEWSESRFFLYLNLIPHVQSIKLAPEGSDGAVEEIRLSRGERVKESAAPAKKELSLHRLDSEKVLNLLERIRTSELESGLPEHTLEWRLRRRLSKELSQRISGIDPILADELIKENGNDSSGIVQTLKEIQQKLTSREFNWCIYDFPKYGEKGRYVLYPMRLPIALKPEHELGFLDAVEFRLHNVVLPSYRLRLATMAVKPLKQELRKLERLKSNLDNDLKEAERAKEYRHIGNLLVTYRHMLRKGMDSVKLKDFSGDRDVLIPLEPSLSPEGNIKRYFSKAKKGENGLVIIRERKRRIEKDLANRKAIMEKTLKMEDIAELLRLVLSDEREKGEARGRARKEKPRFRTFRLDEKHTVFVGRSDSENDELTHRFASPNDIWFHAQGVPGSHVILKGADSSTSKAVLEKAASIAAFFSKAKHSSTVPVIYTEKRYVRKPRKSKPGTAVVQRSKTLFVSPEIPVEVENRKRGEGF